MEEAIYKACIELEILLRERNDEYWYEFLSAVDEYGSIAITLLIKHKLNKLEQLLSKKANDTMYKEKIIGTLLDLAGYIVISKIYLENKK